MRNHLTAVSGRFHYLPFRTAALVDTSKVKDLDRGNPRTYMKAGRYGKGHVFFKILVFGKVFQKLLDLAASMIYVRDFFEKEDGDKDTDKKKTVLTK